MGYDIEITEVQPRLIAAIRVTTSRSNIGDEIASGFGALMGVLSGEGVGPSGPPFVVYHDVIDAETVGDIEIGMPIAGAISGDDTVYSRELEGGAMAITVHRGPYQEIESAYKSLMGWIPEHGYEIAGPPREIYLNDPHTVSPEEILTRVEFPIGDGSG